MRFVPAREIKRRGISAVDEQLKKGPVYIIKNDEPKYVVLSREQFEDMLDEDVEPLLDQVQGSLEDIREGRVRKITPDELAEEFGLRE
jgi:PHD/YefM family antitoxin component YafN of YafNO toxin-antitoxin module